MLIAKNNGTFTMMEGSLAASAGISKMQARQWLIAYRDLAISELIAGRGWHMYGIGNMHKQKYIRANTVNPRTGAHIGASMVKSIKFIPTKAIKDALN